MNDLVTGNRAVGRTSAHMNDLEGAVAVRSAWARIEGCGRGQVSRGSDGEASGRGHVSIGVGGETRGGVKSTFEAEVVD